MSEEDELQSLKEYFDKRIEKLESIEYTDENQIKARDSELKKARQIRALLQDKEYFHQHWNQQDKTLSINDDDL